MNIWEGLTSKEQEEAKQLLRQYEEIFSELPRKTKLIECRLELQTDRPVNMKQYPLPYALRQTIEREVEYLLRLGIVEQSK